MNELIKNIPTFMCHLAFVDKDGELLKLNGSDVDLFWVLVFMVSKSYYEENIGKADDDEKITEFGYHIKDEIKEYVKSNSALKKSIKKLDGLNILVNMMGSYDNKEIKQFTPFRFNYNECSKDEINIVVDEDFIKTFEKPQHKYTLNYNYLKLLKNPQAKLLYIILSDRVSSYRRQIRYIDDAMLKILLNKDMDYKKKNFNEVLKKINIDINRDEYTDITFSYKHESKRKKINAKWKRINRYRFDIRRTKKQEKYIKKNDKSEIYTETEISSQDKTIDDLIDAIVDYEIETYPTKIKNEGGLRVKIRKPLLKYKDYIEEIYTFINNKIVDVEENKQDIDINQSNILQFTLDRHEYLFIDNNYCLYNNYGEQKTKNPEDTSDFLVDNIDNFYFGTKNNDSKKFKLSRLNKATFYD